MNISIVKRSLLSGIATLGATTALLLSTSSALAHVSVTPSSATADTSSIFAFRVPTEREEPTVRLEVTFPAGLTVSRFQPIPGWTRTFERNVQHQITSVTWAGGQIGPGEFQDFVFQARTPKEAGKLAFKAVQVYASGERVAWENPEGSQERPAPLLTVSAAGAATAKPTAGDDHGAMTSAAPNTAAPAAAAPASAAQTAGSASGGSDLSLLLGLGGLVVGLVALVLAIAAFSRRPRETS